MSKFVIFKNNPFAWTYSMNKEWQILPRLCMTMVPGLNLTLTVVSQDESPCYSKWSGVAVSEGLCLLLPPSIQRHHFGWVSADCQLS